MIKTRVDELEKIAAEYHLKKDIPDKFIEDICQEYCCDWLTSLISEDDRIVELGYGDGITLRRLSKKGSGYTVIEGAQSLINVLKKNHPDVRMIHSLFEDYYPEETCHKLLALHVLEHVNEPVSLLKHLRLWLAPDGELIIVVPNKESLHRRLAHKMGIIPELDTLSERDKLVGHQRVYDISSLESDLNLAGFEVIERRGFFLKTLPNGMMLNYSPDLIRGLNACGDDIPLEMLANLAVRARVKN